MGYGTEQARMEAQLAIAHRALFRAHVAAEGAGYVGAALDLEQIMREVSRVAEGSLRGRPGAKPQLDGQLSF